MLHIFCPGFKADIGELTPHTFNSWVRMVARTPSSMCQLMYATLSYNDWFSNGHMSQIMQESFLRLVTTIGNQNFSPLELSTRIESSQAWEEFA